MLNSSGSGLRPFTIAIAGNPNAGKTCIFNALTHSSREVGNYPGVTVEFFEGKAKFGETPVRIVDLPGTYSLTAYSQEEIVARDFILNEKPDVIVDVVDAANLERNLYLTAQFIELRVPMVMALNMVDIAKRKGQDIDAGRLGQILGMEVISTVGSRGSGIDDLKEACLRSKANPHVPHSIALTHELNFAIEPLLRVIENIPALSSQAPTIWLAIKILEDDPRILDEIAKLAPEDEHRLKRAGEQARKLLLEHSGEEPAVAVSEARYGFAAGAAKQVIRRAEQVRRLITDHIDTLVCNRVFGPLILGLVVFILFFSVFKLSEEWAWLPFPNGEWVSPVGFLGRCFDFLALIADRFIPGEMLRSLVRDGIIGGVGGVMGFVPLIFFMFIFVAFLEDCGYIARVAFIMDRLLRVFGLQGKSILAMIVSGGLGAGGCAVPGVMATRTLREEKDRLVTILVSPMMICGAKLPVIAMLIAAFFPLARGRVMFSLWLISWILALISAWVIRKWVIRGEQTPFVMELPVYHLPTCRGIMTHAWNRTWMYIKKAGTLLLAVNIIMWSMMYFPRLPEQRQANFANALENTGNEEQRIALEQEYNQEQLRYSIAGRLGTGIAPLTGLAGFDWRDSIALIGGFAAKEVVVGTLGIVYSMGEIDPDDATPLSDKISSEPGWSPLRAFAMMVFVIIYSPCVAALAVIRRETGSWLWALFAMVYTTVLGFAVAVLIFRGGMLLGIG